MTITDFSLLSIAEQLEILHSEGVYLAKRCIGTRHVILYQYHKLYAEIYYTKYRQVVDRIRYSSSTEFLDAYFDTISIDEIFIKDT